MNNFYLIFLILFLALPFIIKNLKYWNLKNNSNEFYDKILLIRSKGKIYYYLLMLVIYIFVIVFTTILLPLELIELYKKRGKKII